MNTSVSFESIHEKGYQLLIESNTGFHTRLIKKSQFLNAMGRTAFIGNEVIFHIEMAETIEFHFHLRSPEINKINWEDGASKFEPEPSRGAISYILQLVIY